MKSYKVYSMRKNYIRLPKGHRTFTNPIPIVLLNYRFKMHELFEYILYGMSVFENDFNDFYDFFFYVNKNIASN